MAPSSPVRTIDLSLWRDGTPPERAAQARLLDASLREAGFVLVVGHGVAPATSAAVRAAVRELLALPDAVKERYRAPALGTRGWVPMGMEANGYASGTPTPPDLKETWVLTTADVRGHDDALPNRWPDEVPALRQAAVPFLAAAERVHLEVLRLAATALDLTDPDHLVDRAGHDGTCNLNWYPPLSRVGPPEPGQWRIGPHRDFGTITVLDREPGLGGLQVQLGDGTWVDAPWVPGSLVVNCGDLLAAWTGGRWRSAPHRVLPPAEAAPEESLVSLVHFCGAAPDVVVAPLPGLDDEGAFVPFRAGDHMQALLERITVG